MLESLLILVLWIVVIGLIFWLLWYLVGLIPAEPFRTVAKVIVMIIAVFILIYLLLGFLPPLRTIDFRPHG